MKTLFLTTLIVSSIMMSAPTYAALGNSSGGGGDASELRVNEIRADILNWINDGGAKGLELSSNLSYDEYSFEMTNILQPKNVIIGFVEKDDATNDELKVSVNGTPKTCRGFISKLDSKAHILCNIERFRGTSEGEQYKLIHHEYAGLANIENNEGAASDYAISSQLTDFLSKQTVLKLAVKKKDSTSVIGDAGEIELSVGENVFVDYIDDLGAFTDTVSKVYEKNGRHKYLFAGGNKRLTGVFSQNLNLCFISESKKMKVCNGDKVIREYHDDDSSVGVIVGIEIAPSGIFSKKRHIYVRTGAIYLNLEIDDVGIIIK